MSRISEFPRSFSLIRQLQRSYGLLVLVTGFSSALAQTAPPPQNLPYLQNFGSTAFNTLPPGVAAWNGLNGGGINTQSLAESSSPTGNASVTAATSTQEGGACYGYATGGNARFYIQSSSNSTNGVNQLAIAVNTTGWQSITLSYDLEIIVAQTRTIGVVCQYRLGEYRRHFGGNPTGDNDEITAALRGANPKALACLPPEGGTYLDNAGRLIDRWGTPYFFHALSGREMEILSAGPDREFQTADDIRGEP